MPYCPECRSEYRPTFNRCADCDVELVERLPEEPPPDRWSEVYRGQFASADAVRGALEAAGLQTMAPDEYASNLGWYAPSAIGMVRVLVREEDVAQAKEILAGLHRLEAQPPHEPPVERPDQANAPAPELVEGFLPELLSPIVSPEAPGSHVVGLGRLAGRSAFDTFLALVLPLGVALSAAGHPSQADYFLASLLGQPCLVGLAVWRRRQMLKQGEPISLLWGGAPGNHVVVGLAVGAVFAGFSLLYSRLMADLTGEHPDRFSLSPSFATVVKFIAGVGIAPVCEEVFFRGAILGAFLASGKAGWGVFISALLFATMHFAPAYAPLHFVYGIVSALLFIGTRSLLAPIIAHSTTNAVVLVSMLSSLEGG